MVVGLGGLEICSQFLGSEPKWNTRTLRSSAASECLWDRIPLSNGPMQQRRLYGVHGRQHSSGPVLASIGTRDDGARLSGRYLAILRIEYPAPARFGVLLGKGKGGDGRLIVPLFAQSTRLHPGGQASTP